MAITRQESKAFFAERYRWDCGECSTDNGYAQVDTRQDAPYFGIWASPLHRRIVTFCEGDVTITTCDTDFEFVDEIRNIRDFYGQVFVGIDPGFSDSVKQAFQRVGLSDLLH